MPKHANTTKMRFREASRSVSDISFVGVFDARSRRKSVEPAREVTGVRERQRWWEIGDQEDWIGSSGSLALGVRGTGIVLQSRAVGPRERQDSGEHL